MNLSCVDIVASDDKVDADSNAISWKPDNPAVQDFSFLQVAISST